MVNKRKRNNSKKEKTIESSVDSPFDPPEDYVRITKENFFGIIMAVAVGLFTVGLVVDSLMMNSYYSNKMTLLKNELCADHNMIYNGTFTDDKDYNKSLNIYNSYIVCKNDTNKALILFN